MLFLTPSAKIPQAVLLYKYERRVIKKFINKKHRLTLRIK